MYTVRYESGTRVEARGGSGGARGLTFVIGLGGMERGLEIRKGDKGADGMGQTGIGWGEVRCGYGGGVKWAEGGGMLGRVPRRCGVGWYGHLLLPTRPNCTKFRGGTEHSVVGGGNCPNGKEAKSMLGRCWVDAGSMLGQCWVDAGSSYWDDCKNSHLYTSHAIMAAGWCGDEPWAWLVR